MSIELVTPHKLTRMCNSHNTLSFIFSENPENMSFQFNKQQVIKAVINSNLCFLEGIFLICFACEVIRFDVSKSIICISTLNYDQK